MSRQVRDARLETRQARLKLKPSKAPYWRLIHTGFKSGKGRHVPLNETSATFFNDALFDQLNSSYVFTKQGKPWGKNHHIRLLIEACKIAKINPAVRFHELRHTYASWLAQAAVDLLTISKLLGHADTRVTSRHYAHLCDRTLSDAAKLLPKLIHLDNKAKIPQLA